MSLILFDLAAADPEIRFSPHCWKTRMALAHKGLEAEFRPWRFTDKEAISASGQGAVPVLVHNGQTIADSWRIAEYLDAAFPGQPSLFDGIAEKALCQFINHWADVTLTPGIARLLLKDIYASIAECDRGYFRKTREKRFGQSIEEVSADREMGVISFRRQLEPLRKCLANRPYLSGAYPLYADYCVFGFFMWARCISSFELLEADDVLNGWRERLLDAYGGLGRSAPCVTVKQQGDVQ
jgi:glutathione S-transferase